MGSTLELQLARTAEHQNGHSEDTEAGTGCTAPTFSNDTCQKAHDAQQPEQPSEQLPFPPETANRFSKRIEEKKNNKRK